MVCKMSIKSFLRPFWIKVRCFLWQFSLPDLCKINMNDKYGVHFYAIHYQKFFKKYKFKKVKVLEIGVHVGSSLKVWSNYFVRGEILAFDILYTQIKVNKCKILKGDQSDPGFLKEIGDKYGPFDIIIDDGSHLSSHVIVSLECLWKYLKIGGLYCIEDLQTSYWTDYDGSHDVNYKTTSINYLKKIIDEINYEEIPNYKVGQFGPFCCAAHFYHNLCILEKGKNEEGSNRGSIV